MTVSLRTALAPAVLCAAAAALTGCYNNPEVSARAPGEGPRQIHARPSVGPGTVAGGSTAGPQPVRHDAKEHTEPQPWGGVPAQEGLGHAEAPRPVPQSHGDATAGSPARHGNEQGVGERGNPPAH